ncbi:MAG: hypothetical protein KIT14_15750 [bacterium]|nr:hypothetical protein [bacterium]
MTRHGAAAILLSAWVLIEVPPDTMDSQAQAPAIGKARRIQTFASYQDCDNYRIEIMQDEAMTGSDVGLDQTNQMRCVPEAQLNPAPTTTTVPAPPGGS